MIDSASFNVTDALKKDFMMNFVIPEGVRILKSKLKVNSSKIIPQFNADGCDDNGKLTNSNTYSSSTTQGDFVLFLGVVNKPSESFLAYASYCVLGTLFFAMNFWSIFLQFFSNLHF